ILCTNLTVISYRPVVQSSHNSSSFFFLITRLPPISTLFPYTTLFRSAHAAVDEVIAGAGEHPVVAAAAEQQIIAVFAPQIVGARSESTRLNSSHVASSYAVFCLKKKIQAGPDVGRGTSLCPRLFFPPI